MCIFRRALTGALLCFCLGCTGGEGPVAPEEALRQACARIDLILQRDPPGPIPARPPVAAASADQPLTIWYFHHPLFNDLEDTLTERGVPATAHYIGEWSMAVQKLTVSVAADRPPDIAIVDRGWLGPLVHSGRLLALNEALPASALAAYPAHVLDAFRVDGAVYALPADGFASTMVYDPKRVPHPPRTWADLRALAEELRGQTGDSPIGYLPFLEMLWSAGGDVTDGHRCTVESPAGVEALVFLTGLIRDGLATRETMTDPAYALAAFQRGECAITVVPHALLPRLTLNMAVAPVPGKSVPVARWGETALVVFKGAEAGRVPAVTAALDVLGALADSSDQAGNQPTRRPGGLAYVRSTPLLPVWNAVEAELDRWIVRAYMGAARDN